MKRLLAIVSVLAASVAGLSAENRPTVRARLVPDSIGIGDRFELVIEVEKDLVQAVEFPRFVPDSTGRLELVGDGLDTLRRDGRRLRIARRYTLAAFDEGRYNLGRPEVLYADKNIVDTLRADEELLLEVGTFAIDSTSHAIFDLKPQKTLPFRLAEVRTFLIFGLGALFVLVAGLWGVVRYLRRRTGGAGLFGSTPPLPPHVAAIRALETIHHQKLWQNNRHKQYYSGLTDTLRTYIAARWEIGAMEMTSDEIVGAMRRIELPEKARADLATVLRDADLVKFAKATPDAEQNEADYLKCYYFVEETKLVAEDQTTTPDAEFKTER